MASGLTSASSEKTLSSSCALVSGWPLLGQQRAEQRGLAGRERQQGAAEREARASRHRIPAVPHCRRGWARPRLRRISARMRASSSAMAKGLGRVVVGAKVQAAHAFVEGVLRGQDSAPACGRRGRAWP